MVGAPYGVSSPRAAILWSGGSAPELMFIAQTASFKCMKLTKPRLCASRQKEGASKRKNNSLAFSGQQGLSRKET